MKSLLFTALFIIIATSNCAASLTPESAARIRALTLEGLEHAYNFDFTTANKLFDEAIAAEPLSPRPYVSKTSLALWQFLLSKNDADYKTFLSLADRTIETGDRYLDKYGEDAEVLTCLGMAYGYRAFAHGRAKSYLKAAWDGKKSYDYFYDALKLDPRSYDAYMGTGIFHYFTSYIAKPLRWIVSILGISSDSELGIKEIRLAAKNGLYTKVEAQYYLAQFLPWEEGDFTTSEKIINDLLRQYPGNSLLKFTLAVWEIRSNNVRSAKDHLLSIIQNENSAVEGVKRFAQYKLAECYFRLQDFEQAREAYRNFLTENHDETYIATSNYRIGICYEMTGQRELSLSFYRSASKADAKFGDDAYAARHSTLRLKIPLDTESVLLLQGQNALKCGIYSEALNHFKQLVDRKNLSPDLIVEATYGLGETFFEQGLYVEAHDQFEIVSRSSILNEQWLTPWSHYQIGLCLVKLAKFKEARKAFEQVLEFDDYDFRNWLNFRSERELAKLKK